MKKIISVLLISILLLSFTAPVAASHSFQKANTYKNQFSDISESDWFYSYVKEVYEYGLMKGSSDYAFSPDANLTIAEAITIAVRMRSLYSTGKDFSAKVALNETWYDPYVNYAVQRGIIKENEYNYTAFAKRSDVASIFYAALPREAFSETLSIADNSIPDVRRSSFYAEAVYTLYRAGILTGSDSNGTFNPDSAIKRSEIATICVRIAAPEKRATAIPEKKNPSSENPKTPETELTPEEISKKCSDAVFYIETYSRNGKLSGSASGFFISADGYAVTNCHVIENSGYIEIKLPDGRRYHGAVAGNANKSAPLKVIDFDEEKDIALLKIDGSSFPYIETGDSRNLVQGQTVYAIGSPAGLENTMSMGIISRTTPAFPSLPDIQISVPITHGSSGGVLLNTSGKAIGITSAGLESAADLNFAVPIHEIEKLDRYILSPSELALDSHNLIRHKTGPFGDIFYPLAPDVIDFGAFSGSELLEGSQTLLSGAYRYDIYDYYECFGKDDSENYATTLVQYNYALEICGFKLVKSNNDDSMRIFEKDGLSIGIAIFYSDTANYKKGLYIIYDYEPIYYKDTPSVIDFGYAVGIKPEDETKLLNGFYTTVYKWKDLYSEKTILTLVNAYFDTLMQYGFEFYQDNLYSYYLYSVGEDEIRVFGKGKSVVSVMVNNNYIYVLTRSI
ncbi:MAG: trypsin-like peptidase domain-containing protein [Clostridia bacterium]|nr:trypsin-like peptidase domain-containing protein [Clostridia bacterium]